jgi:HEAT repeat protein
MTTAGALDLFLSYSSADRSFAQRLATDLTAYGLRVWWDHWEMRVGDSLTEKIQDGISRSSWLAILLSPDSVNAPWVKRELSAALAEEIEGSHVIVLPLLIAECNLPPFLKDRKYADFRDSYESGLGALLARVASPIRPNLAEDLLSECESRVLRAYAKIAAGERPKYQEFLFEKLSSPSSHDRLTALYALSTLRNPGLRLHLGTMLADPSSAVRARIARCFAQFGRTESIAAIERLMQDENPAVRSAARTAYRRVTGSAP